MARLVRFAGAVTCAVATIWAGLARAQEQPSGSGSSSNAERFTNEHPEVLRVHMTLMRLLLEAFDLDPRLEELRADFEAAQEEAMIALDPQTRGRFERMAELRSLYDQTEASEQTADVDGLLDEGRTIGRELLATAKAARRQPGVAEKAEAFASALAARFQEIDPEGFELLAQVDGWIEAVWAALLITPHSPSGGAGGGR